MDLDCVAIILGRKGSAGIKNKNTMEILNRPINHYSILAAKNSKYISKIYLSTDDNKIIAQTKKFGIEFISRPKYLCQMKHYLKTL